MLEKTYSANPGYRFALKHNITDPKMSNGYMYV